MTNDFQDYYQQLGVPPTATQEEIRAAFRRLARLYHPDIATDKKEAEEKFKEINEAYEVLGDPEKRRKYDAYQTRKRNLENLTAQISNIRSRQKTNGSVNNTPKAPITDTPSQQDYQVNGTGFSDFFERLFGSSRTHKKRHKNFFSSASERGQDIEADFLVRLEESLHGAVRTISFRRTKTGKTETYLVKIPKGVREGQKIRLAGVGEEGKNGGPPGDLYLRVKLQKHPDFRVVGPDLFYDLEIPAYRLVLGTEVEIPTLEGKARLKIPPGTQATQRFRLAGLGLPTETPNLRGDLIVCLIPTLPRNISPAEMRLWREIEKMNQKKK
ncbi:MAG: J domain-containing protein [Chthoniobacterales bacterium]|nr:J domain-containing protein [Chthoniobacterales bacterium]